ncbi:MAG: PepSY domain-containing protein [Xanthobacteraceae bacterium]
MAALRLFVIAGLAAATLTPSLADETPHRVCLSKDQQREEIASGQVVKLEAALRSVEGRRRGDVINARLCRGAKGLVYVLTVLAGDGKVTRVTIDATNGTLIGRR